MINTYKCYARDLYDIRISVAGKPAEDNISSLNIFLETIQSLRAKFRLELNELSQEFISSNASISPEDIEEIKRVNSLFTKKLQAFANQTGVKIKRLSQKMPIAA